MSKIPFTILIGLTSLLFVGTGCNSEAPTATIISIDSTDRVAEKAKEEIPEYTVHLSPYDGTAETAHKQVNEIMKAIDEKKLTGYSYLYNDNSGEDEKQGLLCFSYFNGPEKDWYLRLNTKHNAMEYFFGKENELFAIREWEYVEGGANLIAEIFYQKPEGLLKGSWLKRMNEDTTDLASYKGDYWYDFLEGWPLYHDTKSMRADKSLQYQQ
ncbi:MAG: hypothetical protein IPJ32_07230 [Sphingobacteriaceae bacterium]|nr:hypothetical protein [Sphingobacteriaceae bacterium]